MAERTELAEARTRQLQGLAVELVESEERERKRIAELLYDDLQQVLAAAKMHLQAASRQVPGLETVSKVEALLNESINKSRRLSHELSPAVVYQSDLLTALKWLAAQVSEQWGLKVDIEANATQQVENPSLKVFLFRSLQELLFNVRKHAGVDSARVEISDSDKELHMSVTDHGRGFDPESLGAMNGKNGLGLVSLRERAQAIGGGLTIESAPGVGSTFMLRVPKGIARAEKRDRADLSDTGTFFPRETAREFGKDKDKGIRVLFVDDHKVMRHGLIQLVTGQPDIQVVGEAENGREAVEQARNLSPDVVVMDALMPEMSGEEATRIIKSEQPGVRIIGLSMLSDEHIAREMRDAGAEVFLSKTVSPAELLKAIYGIEGTG